MSLWDWWPHWTSEGKGPNFCVSLKPLYYIFTKLYIKDFWNSSAQWVDSDERCSQCIQKRNWKKLFLWSSWVWSRKTFSACCGASLDYLKKIRKNKQFFFPSFLSFYNILYCKYQNSKRRQIDIYFIKNKI